jgi:hypothetical protein
MLKSLKFLEIGAMSFYVYEMTKKEISISMMLLGAPRKRINERTLLTC